MDPMWDANLRKGWSKLHSPRAKARQSANVWLFALFENPTEHEIALIHAKGCLAVLPHRHHQECEHWAQEGSNIQKGEQAELRDFLERRLLEQLATHGCTVFQRGGGISEHLPCGRSGGVPKGRMARVRVGASTHHFVDGIRQHHPVLLN